MPGDIKVTIAKVPFLADDVLEYVVFQAEDGEFPQAVIDAAEEELDRREASAEMYPRDAPPEAGLWGDRNEYMPSYGD